MPALAVTARWSCGKAETPESAPRTLNAPVGWKVSSLRKPSGAIGLDTSGVGSKTECTVCQADSMSSKVGVRTDLVASEELPMGAVMV